MFQRSFLALAFVALVVLMATTDSVVAQKGGGGRGGGGRSGGGAPRVGGSPRVGGGVPVQRGGVYPGGNYYRGYRYGPGPGYRGIYYGSPYAAYFGGIGGFGGGFYYSSPFLYADPYFDIVPRYSFYPETTPRFNPQPIAPMAPADPDDKSARVRVLLPDPQAKVLFDGNPTKQSGTDRLFHTPDLAPRATPYTYRIRASWKVGKEEQIQERVVEVTPGKTSVADFR